MKISHVIDTATVGRVEVTNRSMLVEVNGAVLTRQESRAFADALRSAADEADCEHERARRYHEHQAALQLLANQR